MEVVQVVVIAFFALLPVVLMLDYWGDERLDARGRPKPRAWPRSRRPDALDADTHDETAGLAR